MNTTKSNSIIDTISSEVTTTKNIKAIQMSIIIGIIGAIIMIISILFSKELNSTIYLLLFSTSIFIICTALIKAIWFSKQLVYQATQSKANNYSIYYKSDVFNILTSAISSGDVSTLKKLKQEHNSELRVDFVVSVDMEFFVCQIFKYIPFQYEPETSLMIIDKSKRDELLKFIMASNLS